MEDSKLILFILVFVFLFIIRVLYHLNYAKIKGKAGEKRVANLLSQLGDEYRVLNDVMIPNTNGSTTQIDHIVFSPYGVFVIETKNYNGWIYGGEYTDYWIQNIWGNKTRFLNPIKQNKGHIAALKRILPQYTEGQFISIVVFTQNSTLKSSFRDEANVITTHRLKSLIHQYREPILSDTDLVNIQGTLMSRMIMDKEADKVHATSVKQKQQEHEEMIRNGICPRCGGQLVERRGKYGRFYGCSNYPKCRFTLKP